MKLLILMDTYEILLSKINVSGNFSLTTGDFLVFLTVVLSTLDI